MSVLKNGFLATLFVALTLFPSPSAHGAATNVVKMIQTGTKFLFSPTNITINSGDTIKWTNTVANQHDTTHNPPSGAVLWQSGELSSTAASNSFSFKFINPGFYPYYCLRHVVLLGTNPEQTGTVSVVSANLAPSVSLTNPANGSQFFSPASFILKATASDSDGAVAQVEFFRGATSLGVSAVSPYSNNVNALPIGSYAFTAVATDNQGAKATSSVVNVTVVQDNQAPVLAPLADWAVGPEVGIIFTNSATDPDIPTNRLTFSLDPGAPAGAKVNPTNGVFRWRAKRSQAPSTNVVVVRVTDDGVPP